MTPAAGARRDSSLRLLGDAFSARVMLAGFSVVSIFAVAHKVPVSTYGIYVVATAFATLFNGFTDLGSAMVAVREGAGSDDAHRVARTYVHVRIFFVVVTCVIASAMVPLAFPADAQSAGFLSVATLLFCGVSMLSPLGQIFGSMRSYRVGCLVQGGVTLAATLTVVETVKDPSALWLVSTNVIGAAVGTLFAARVGITMIDRIWVAFDRAMGTKMVKAMTLLGLGTVVTAVYGKIDSIMLLSLGGSHAAGLYGAANRLLDQSAIVPIAILVPISPLLAVALRNGGRLRPGFDRALARAELYAGLALALGVVALAHWVALGLLGHRFVTAGNLLCLLAVTQAWVVLAYVSTAKLVHANLVRPYVAVTILGLALNVGINIILIPRYHAYGATYATLATEFVTVVGYTWVARRVSSNTRVISLLLAVGVSGGGCGLMLFALRRGTAIALAASVFCLFVALAFGMAALISLRRDLPAADVPKG